MAKTRGDLCAEVLDQLGMVGAGQTPDPGDLDKVDLLLNGALDGLQRRYVIAVANRGVYGQPTSGAIEEALFVPLAQALTKPLATKFGAAFADYAAMATDGESQMRAMQAETQLDEPIRAVYY